MNDAARVSVAEEWAIADLRKILDQATALANDAIDQLEWVLIRACLEVLLLRGHRPQAIRERLTDASFGLTVDEILARCADLMEES